MRVTTYLPHCLASMMLFGLALAAQAADLEFSNIPGYDFSLGDVQKECMAHRHSGNSLEIQCKKDNMKPVQRNCEGFISRGLSDVSFSCRGNLWIVSNKCKVKMLGSRKGEMSCAF